jgi:hypothetical protein
MRTSQVATSGRINSMTENHSPTTPRTMRLERRGILYGVSVLTPEGWLVFDTPAERLRQDVPGTMGPHPPARHEGRRQTKTAPHETRQAQPRRARAQMRHDNAAVTAAGRATSSAGDFGFSGEKWWS